MPLDKPKNNKIKIKIKFKKLAERPAFYLFHFSAHSSKLNLSALKS